MKNFKEKMLSSETASFAGAVQDIINRTSIIEYGLIKEVIAPGVVLVETSVAINGDDIKVIPCVLAGITSQNLSINIEPAIGDKVVVFFPRRYSSAMFSPDKKESEIDTNAGGYNVFGGIAFLCNQLKTKHYKNILHALTTGLSLKLAYDKDSKTSKAEVEITNEGKFQIKNENASAIMDSTGAFEINGKGATVTIGADGNISIDAKAGKIEIKNTAANLGKILSDLMTTLSTLKTPGYVISPDNATLIIKAQQELALLLAGVTPLPAPPKEPETK